MNPNDSLIHSCNAQSGSNYLPVLTFFAARFAAFFFFFSFSFSSSRR